MGLRNFTLVALVVTGACAAFAGAGCGGIAAGSDPPPPRTAIVVIDARTPGHAVPREFPGLSFELTSLPLLNSYATQGDLADFLHALGGGLLRLGGVSADTRVAYPVRHLPTWAASSLNPRDFIGLARLARTAGWRVLLTLNLAHYNPPAAAAEVAIAHVLLRGRLAAIEVGNEADAYNRHGLRGPHWSFAQYRRQVAAYLNAIHRHHLPHIALAGPDVSGSAVFKRWGPAEASELHPALLTGHHYPLGCQDIPPPSIQALLSPTVREAERVSLYRYATISRLAHIPFRLDETGSVSCGGRPGISDTFAAALWAADFMAAAMKYGIVGVNFHGNLANCDGYSPLCASTPADLTDGRLTAQPVWYSLILAHLLTGDHPLLSHISRDGANVDAFAFRQPPRAITVLIVEKDITAAPIIVRIPTHLKRATELWLRAPSATSTSGVTLGGSEVSSTGQWHPTSVPSVANSGGAISVTMPAASAVLLTMR